MKTVIMAGGRGTRIASLAPNIPKPLVLIDGVPVLEREIECLHKQGFDDILLTVSHMGQDIREYFGDGSGRSPVTGKAFGVRIGYYFENTPLGNAGALFKLRDILTDDFLLLSADVLFDVDLHRFTDFHRKHGGMVTLFTHPNDHPYDSGLIVTDAGGAVAQWLTKEDARPRWYKNRVNAGLHLISPAVLDAHGIDATAIGAVNESGRGRKLDLDRQILRPLAGTGRMFAYDSTEYIKDMGTPERFETVCEDFRSGLIARRNLKNKQKAVFLDRDGTINRYVGFLRDIDMFELLPGAAEAIRAINRSGFLAVIVSNQPVVARGEVTLEQLNAIHNKMETLLGNEGAFIDALYYCPHHPHSGFAGEVPSLKKDCECRKPKPGMLLRAAETLNIDLSVSWMVGDGENDVLAGKAAGCKTALIGTGNFGQDLTVGSLKEYVAVAQIKGE